MTWLPYIAIIFLNVANCRFKRIKYGRYDIHDIMCMVISIIGICVILI